MTVGTKKRKGYSSIQAMIRRPADRYKGIYKFRTTVEESAFLSAYHNFFPLKNSLQDYHGPAFPKSARQIFSIKSPKKPVNVNREILWSIARCQKFADHLEEFTKQRERFECAILLNQHTNTQQILNEIEDKFGKSIWLYQNQLASAYISPNESTPSEVATRISDEVKENNVLSILLYYVRRRMEGATLREKLRSELDEQIESRIYHEYFSAKVFDLAASNASTVANLLFIDSQASLLDHYTSLILTLQAAASDAKLTEDTVRTIFPALAKLYESTQDRRLLGILNILGDTPAYITHGCLQRMGAIEAYTEGNFEECEKLAQTVLNLDPLDSAVRLLYIKALVAMDKQPDEIGGPRGEIHNNLFNVLSANEKFFPSVHALIILADRFSDHHWMLYLRVALWNEINAEEETKTPTWTRDVYVRECFVSPFIALTVDSDHSHRILQTLEEAGVFKKTNRLVREIIECSINNNSGATSRQAKYIARELLSKQKFSEASKFYQIAAAGETRAAARLRALGGQALALMLDKQYHEAIETIIEAYQESPHAPLLLPFQELVKRLPDADQWPNTICLGLMLSIANELDVEEDLSKIRLAFEKFCGENNISNPEDLAKRIEEFEAPKVVAYIEDVWQPEVMRQTLMYMRPGEIEEARIQAYQVLTRIDSQRARAHREELASLIKQQEIAKTTALVEQSKVYVDIEAIKRALRTRMKSSYAQYKSSLTQHTRQHNAVLDQLQTVFKDFDQGTSFSNILSSFHLMDGHEQRTQTDIQFSALFIEIIKEFLSGDHGLNAYLSTRVRHGKFVDALRKSVTDEHLVTTRHEDGTYVPNAYWSEVLAGTSYAEAVDKALQIFAINFDTTLLFVRDRKVQIRTYYELKAMDENTEGLFHYQFSNLERQLMQRNDADLEDFDELIIKCVDSLWEKTDTNLATVREYISTTLRNELLKLFDVLSTEITSICNDVVPSTLSNAIARSRTATQQALENVEAWFRRSEVYDRQDFDIDFPGQIAANMVNRTLSLPSNWKGPIYESMQADAKMPGRTLDTLVDIFYVLFENAVKYAELESVPLCISVKMSVKEGEFSASVSSNARSPTPEKLQKLHALRGSFSAPESRRLAQSEGRSGFRKILLALGSPLYRTSSLDFDHLDDQFKVSFSFKL